MNKKQLIASVRKDLIKYAVNLLDLINPTEIECSLNYKGLMLCKDILSREPWLAKLILKFINIIKLTEIAKRMFSLALDVSLKNKEIIQKENNKCPQLSEYLKVNKKKLEFIFKDAELLAAEQLLFKINDEQCKKKWYKQYTEEKLKVKNIFSLYRYPGSSFREISYKYTENLHNVELSKIDKKYENKLKPFDFILKKMKRLRENMFFDYLSSQELNMVDAKEFLNLFSDYKNIKTKNNKFFVATSYQIDSKYYKKNKCTKWINYVSAYLIDDIDKPKLYNENFKVVYKLLDGNKFNNTEILQLANELINNKDKFMLTLFSLNKVMKTSKSQCKWRNKAAKKVIQKIQEAAMSKENVENEYLSNFKMDSLTF